MEMETVGNARASVFSSPSGGMPDGSPTTLAARASGLEAPREDPQEPGKSPAGIQLEERLPVGLTVAHTQGGGGHVRHLRDLLPGPPPGGDRPYPSGVLALQASGDSHGALDRWRP